MACSVGSRMLKPSEQVSVTVAPAVGPPTTHTTASGSGFKADQVVKVYFDGTEVAKRTTDQQGNFSKGLQVPASATPGSHDVTASVKRTSAHTKFVVQTDWPQFRNNVAHTGFNAFENVINPSNVSSLGPLWTVSTGGQVYCAPAV